MSANGRTAMDFGAAVCFCTEMSDGVETLGQTRAFANSPDVLYLSRGSFDKALLTASSISSGTDESVFLREGTGSLNRLLSIACVDDPSNAFFPVIISKIMHARLY